MPGDITLPDKDGHLYTVSREEPSASFDSLGLRTNLCGTSEPALEDVTKVSYKFSTQIKRLRAVRPPVSMPSTLPSCLPCHTE